MDRPAARACAATGLNSPTHHARTYMNAWQCHIPAARRPSTRTALAGRVSGRLSFTLGALIAVAALAVAAALTILPRLHARSEAAKETVGLNVPAVAVISPKAGEKSQEIVLPGNMEPYIDTAIYARTNGYVKRWTADIGTHVRSGELLAEIDTPEVDDQLRQARAEVDSAEVNYQVARRTSERWQELLVTGTVSKHQAEQVEGEMRARKAALESARHNVARLEKLQSFSKIYAPFEGVITARNVDVGALIDAGADRELFHIASTQKLRVYVNVPQIYSRDVRRGMPAELKLLEFPGRSFMGKVVRDTQSIDVQSRTLRAEVEVDNASGELLPGAYAQVHLLLSAPGTGLILPVNAILFRSDGTQVAVVTSDQHVRLKPVELGRDFGTEVEILSGIEKDDDVIANPSDSIVAGTPVRVIAPAPPPDASSSSGARSSPAQSRS